MLLINNDYDHSKVIIIIIIEYYQYIAMSRFFVYLKKLKVNMWVASVDI